MRTGPPQGPTSLLPLRDGSSLEAGSEVEIIKGGFLQSAFASTFVKGRARKEWAEGEAELLSVSTEVSADPTRSAELSPHMGQVCRASVPPYWWLDVSLDVGCNLGQGVSFHPRHSLKGAEG